MPQQIDVPGMGVVEFPDGMTDDQITAAIQANTPQAQPSYSGSILPFTRDASGTHFDSNAGILGTIKQAIGAAMLPGDVYSGKTPIMSGDHTNPEVIDRAANLAALATPVNPAVRAGARAFGGAAPATKTTGFMPPAYKPVPSADALKSAAEAGYSEARGLGIELKPSSISDLATTIKGGLEQDGLLNEKGLARGTHRILDRLAKGPQASEGERAFSTIQNIEAARKSLGLIARNYNNRADQLAATRSIQQLDNWLGGIGEDSVMAGPASAAGRILKDARGNYAAAKRSADITNRVESADLRAAIANSGRNVDNAIRRRIGAILDSPSLKAGYSPEEIAAMDSIARGTAGTNTLRYIGNLLGGGGGLGQALTAGGGAALGGASGGPLGAAAGAVVPSLVGASAKTAANALTKRQASRLDSLIRQRSPLFEATRPVPKDVAQREAMTKMLMLLGLNPNQVLPER